ncbi:MAG: tRNA 4-thiouridine(8) synthase ThiI [Erysipelotrichaceae bacterium]|nr:tRNA 4-thiouridine(8) synthase ThiI [Erysipelotrichaceae bacterium]
MEYTHILIRYGELTTKGKNRKTFIATLYENIKRKLYMFNGLEYEKNYDRIFIKLNGNNPDIIKKELNLVSGLYSYSFVVKVENDLDKIKEISLKFALENEERKFKVKAHRNDKSFPYVSDSINREVAGYILKNSKLRVDVHNPDLLLQIEVRPEGTYVFDNAIKGLGGYPLGVGGEAMLMLSGGIDSPVAGFLINKRGLTYQAIHFASPPYTSEKAIDKVKDLLKKLTVFQKEIKLHIIPFTDLQVAIYDNADESYAITLMRRMMYRISDLVAREEKCLALINGESIGQVASQTLESMNVINEVTTMPVIRPLACYDKLDIIDLSQMIDTYEISIRPHQDCCTIFEPKNPVTKPKLDKCKEYEEKFDFESLIVECVKNREIIKIKFAEEKDEYL